MPSVHSTAIVEGDVQLADDVVVGPGCVLTGPIEIGAGSRLVGNVYVQGPLVMGERNVAYPFACLGFAPQHAKYDPATPGLGTVIGDDNTFREQATVHRAFQDDGPTTIGDRNLLMVGSHIGHDCVVANDCTFVNNTALGGHVHVEDRVIVGGATVVHQFCRLGHGAMLSGAVATTLDVPPWFILSAINCCAGVNLIGLRRSDTPRETIDDVRWVYRTLYRRGLSPKNALEELRTRAERPIVGTYVTFIENSDRGICAGRPKAHRGAATA